MLIVGGVSSMLSTTTATDVAVVWFPAASRATAVRDFGPSPTVVESQDIEYGALVSSGPRLAPLRRNWTPTTPTLSDAFALTIAAPRSVAPGAGAVMLTAGGVLSLNTVTVTESDVQRTPR